MPPVLPPLRIGQGFDIHRFVEGRPLILGGCTIPHSHGLLGHSDADALLHAITDAFLGALALGDIGRHFPDTDAAYKNADSAQLLRQALALPDLQGWTLVNLDCTIITQAPRLASHIDSIRSSIASIIGCEASQISVKAKTHEKLGSLGRSEGLSAHATLLLARLS